MKKVLICTLIVCASLLFAAMWLGELYGAILVWRL